MNEKTTEIKFKPVCDNCGYILKHIRYTIPPISTPYYDTRPSFFMQYQFNPQDCPCCGAHINALVLGPITHPDDAGFVYIDEDYK